MANPLSNTGKEMGKDLKNGVKDVASNGIEVARDQIQQKIEDWFEKYDGPREMSKNFLHARDFYSFIRARSGKNAPTPFYYFSVNFYNFTTDEINLSTGTFKEGFFTTNMQQFVRFRYCIQGISFPAISIRGGYDTGTSTGGAGQKDISNLFGGYTILQNSFIGADQHTLDMNVLNVHEPVIENFIYPWMLEALRSSYENTAPIPRVNMAVKYWSPNHIGTKMEGVKPDFVYYITGLFPVKITTYKPTQMSSGDGGLMRSVTFAFNDFVILNSESDALKYNLGEFFVGNLANTMIDKWKNKALNYLQDKIDEGAGKLQKKLNDLFKDKDKKDKKKLENPNNNDKGGGNGNKGGNPPDGSKPETPNSPEKTTDNSNGQNQQPPENPNNQQNSQENQMNSNQAAQNSQSPQTQANRQLNSSNVTTYANSSIQPSSASSNMGMTILSDAQNRTNSQTNASSQRSNATMSDAIRMVNILNADEGFDEIIDVNDETPDIQEASGTVDRETQQLRGGDVIDITTNSVKSAAKMVSSRSLFSSSEPATLSRELFSIEEAEESVEEPAMNRTMKNFTIDEVLDHSGSIHSDYKNSVSNDVQKDSTLPINSGSSVNKSIKPELTSSISSQTITTSLKNRSTLDSVKSAYETDKTVRKTISINPDFDTDSIIKTASANRSNSVDVDRSTSSPASFNSQKSNMSLKENLAKIEEDNTPDEMIISDSEDELSFTKEAKPKDLDKLKSEVDDSLKVEIEDNVIKPKFETSSDKVKIPENAEVDAVIVKSSVGSADSQNSLGNPYMQKTVDSTDNTLYIDIQQKKMGMNELDNESPLKMYDRVNAIKTELDTGTNLKSYDRLNVDRTNLEDSLADVNRSQNIMYSRDQLSDMSINEESLKSQISRSGSPMLSAEYDTKNVSRIGVGSSHLDVSNYIDRQSSGEKNVNAETQITFTRENVADTQNSDDGQILVADDELYSAKENSTEKTKYRDQIDASQKASTKGNETDLINSGKQIQIDKDQAILNSQDIQKSSKIGYNILTSELDANSSSNESNNDASKSNLSLKANMDMVKQKNSDEDFEEIIDAEDEAEVHAEMNSTDILSALKKSVSTSSQLDVTKYSNTAAILIKDQKMTTEKYHIFNEYATSINVDVRDVINRYKSTPKEELEKFAADIVKTLKDPTDSRNSHVIEVKNGKLVPYVIPEKTADEIKVIKQKNSVEYEIKKKDSETSSHPVIVPKKELSEDDINDLF